MRQGARYWKLRAERPAAFCLCVPLSLVILNVIQDPEMLRISLKLISGSRVKPGMTKSDD